MTDSADTLAMAYNLDAMNRADLHQAAKHFETMARYCRVKADAMQHRMMGEIDKAQRLESLCQSLYETLPAPWAW